MRNTCAIRFAFGLAALLGTPSGALAETTPGAKVILTVGSSIDAGAPAAGSVPAAARAHAPMSAPRPVHGPRARAFHRLVQPYFVAPAVGVPPIGSTPPPMPGGGGPAPICGAGPYPACN